MASNIEYALPDFVIVGVMKCGTTSLFNHLISHPCIAEPLVKGVKYYNKSFDRGEGWYRAHFPAQADLDELRACLLYTSPSPRDKRQSRMPSSA